MGPEPGSNANQKRLRIVIIAAVVLIGLTNIITGLSALYAHRLIAANDRDVYVRTINSPPVFGISTCAETEYSGKETLLYNDRDYHTARAISTIAGYTFCKTGRHSRNYWIVEVLRDTDLYTLGTAEYNFVTNGWNKSAVDIYVDAIGLKLNRMFKKRFKPGVYIINSLPAPEIYPFLAMALPVFWRKQDVNVLN